MYKKFTILILVVILLSMVFAFTVNAAGYPDKPITVLIGFGPGGATDTLVRIVGKYTDKYFGQPFVVVNKPGANTEIEMMALKDAKPDGYTLGTVNIPHAPSNTLMRKTGYAMSDYTPIVNLVTDPGVVGINPDEKKFQSIKGLIVYAKQHPGELTWAVSGIGSDDHIAAILFMAETGCKVNVIPYKSDAEIRAALMGKHVDVAGLNVGNCAEYVAANTIKAIAVMAEERHPSMPDVPTFKEMGYPSIISASNRGLLAPLGLSEEIKSKLVDSLRKLTQDPDFLKDCEAAVQPLDIKFTDDYKKLIDNRVELFAKLYKIQPWGK